MPAYLERELASMANEYRLYNQKHLFTTSNYNNSLIKDQTRRDHEDIKQERILSDNYVQHMVGYNRRNLTLALKNNMTPYSKNRELVYVLDQWESIRKNLESGDFTKPQGNQAFYEYNNLAA